MGHDIFLPGGGLTADAIGALDASRARRELTGRQGSDIRRLADKRIALARSSAPGFTLTDRRLGIFGASDGLDTVASVYGGPSEEYGAHPDLPGVRSQAHVLNRTPGGDTLALRTTEYSDERGLVIEASTNLGPDREPLWTNDPKTVKACLGYFGFPTE